jgi:hypothetical protein
MQIVGYVRAAIPALHVRCADSLARVWPHGIGLRLGVGAKVRQFAVDIVGSDRCCPWITAYPIEVRAIRIRPDIDVHRTQSLCGVKHDLSGFGRTRNKLNADRLAFDWLPYAVEEGRLAEIAALRE